jgi:hypothetical protein
MDLAAMAEQVWQFLLAVLALEMVLRVEFILGLNSVDRDNNTFNF